MQSNANVMYHSSNDAIIIKKPTLYTNQLAKRLNILSIFVYKHVKKRFLVSHLLHIDTHRLAMCSLISTGRLQFQSQDNQNDPYVILSNHF